MLRENSNGAQYPIIDHACAAKTWGSTPISIEEIAGDTIQMVGVYSLSLLLTHLERMHSGALQDSSTEVSGIHGIKERTTPARGCPEAEEEAR